jgi:hypothetical protein
MIAFLLGGRAWIFDIAQFHGISISMLVILGVVVVYAFRRNFLAGGPGVRLNATRDAAFLALGATVAAVEFGLVVELLSRVLPARQA